MKRWARLSEDGIYRWELGRSDFYDAGMIMRDDPMDGATLMSIGLNPSTADDKIDDPTIMKDIGFAKRWRCEIVRKYNAYGFRATDPAVMKRARKSGKDVIGWSNDAAIAAALTDLQATGGMLMLNWGNHIEPKRQRELAALFDKRGITPMCLGTNQNGTPVHELYIPYDRQPVPWRCP